MKKGRQRELLIFLLRSNINGFFLNPKKIILLSLYSDTCKTKYAHKALAITPIIYTHHQTNCMYLCDRML